MRDFTPQEMRGFCNEIKNNSRLMTGTTGNAHNKLQRRTDHGRKRIKRKD